MDDLREKLKKYKVPELKKIAKFLNKQKRIYYSKLKKAELVDAIIEHLNYRNALLQQSEFVEPETTFNIPQSEDDIRKRMNILANVASVYTRSKQQVPPKITNEYKALRDALTNI